MSDQPKNRFMQLLDAEREQQGLKRLETIPPPPPDVPDPEHPAPPQGAASPLDRAIGLAPAKNVVERVRKSAQQRAAAEELHQVVQRVPYEPPHMPAVPPPPPLPRRPWYARFWSEVTEAWRRL